jgi:hypothetical protein
MCSVHSLSRGSRHMLTSSVPTQHPHAAARQACAARGGARLLRWLYMRSVSSTNSQPRALQRSRVSEAAPPLLTVPRRAAPRLVLGLDAGAGGASLCAVAPDAVAVCARGGAHSAKRAQEGHGARRNGTRCSQAEHALRGTNRTRRQRPAAARRRGAPASAAPIRSRPGSSARRPARARRPAGAPSRAASYRGTRSDNSRCGAAAFTSSGPHAHPPARSSGGVAAVPGAALARRAAARVRAVLNARAAVRTRGRWLGPSAQPAPRALRRWRSRACRPGWHSQARAPPRCRAVGREGVVVGGHDAGRAWCQEGCEHAVNTQYEDPFHPLHFRARNPRGVISCCSTREPRAA